MISRLRINLDPLLALMLALPTGFWFASVPLVFPLDSFYGFNTSVRLEEALYAWDDHTSVGVPSTLFGVAPLYAAQHLLQVGGLSIHWIQVITQYTVAFLMAWSCLWALRMVVPQNTWLGYFARIAGAVFYIYNPWQLSWTWWRQMFVQFGVALTPALFRFLRDIFCLRRDRAVRRVWMFLGILIMAAPSTTPVYLLSTTLVMGIFLITLYCFEASVRMNSYRILWVVTALVAAGAWWGIQAVVTVPLTYSLNASALNAASADTSLIYASQYSTFERNFIGLGNWLLYQSNGVFYDWPAQYLTNKITWPLLQLPTLLWILSWRSVNTIIRPIAAALLVVAIVLLMLMKGTAPPLPQLNTALLHVPFGAVFRHPVTVLGGSFYASQMFGVSWAIYVLGRLGSSRLRAR